MSATSAEPTTIRVAMGGIRFAEPPDVLATLLGSCVGIAVWDERSGHAGLAHAVLPNAKGDVVSPGKFVDTAVLELKKRLLERGASACGLRAKVAGGAILFGSKTETIGTRNCEAALHYLQEQNIPVVAEHLGGSQGRMIRFSLSDWSLEVETARKLVAVI